MPGQLEKMLNSVQCYTKEAWEKYGADSFVTAPVTTGPYKVVSYIPGSSVDLTVNENYWQTDLTLRYSAFQNVHNIHYQIIKELSQQAIGLQTGTLDIASQINQVDVSTFENNPDYTIHSYVNLAPYQLFFNMWEGAATSDINLRKAIIYAINVEEMISGLGVDATKLTSYLSSELVDSPEEWADDDYFSYNEELAKQYLAESGYEGQTLKLLVQSSAAGEAAALIIKTMLAKLDIDVEITCYESAMFKQVMYEKESYDLMIDTKGGGTYAWMCYQNGWNHESNAVNFEGYNMCFLDDEKFDELYQNMVQSGASEESYLAIQEYMDENALCFGMFQTWITVVSKSTTDFFYNADHSYLVVGASQYSGKITED